MISVWNPGQNYVSNNHFYLTSHLLSSSSTSLLGVGTEVLEGGGQGCCSPSAFGQAHLQEDRAKRWLPETCSTVPGELAP